MKIEAIKITLKTEKGIELSRKIDFIEKDQTNNICLIHGENSLGKTSLVKCIIYSLNCEDLYGKRGVNNYFTDVFQIYKGQSIIEGYVYLQVTNSDNKQILIKRNLIDNLDPIIVYKSKKISEISSNENGVKKYFYKVNKDRNLVGNKTFQEFLFEYLKLPKIIGENNRGENVLRIYLQNIFPLMIIPQSSWNGIQDYNPNYGVADIKKRAFEIVLNLDSIKNLDKRLKLNLLKGKLDILKKEEIKITEIISLYEFQNLEEIERRIEEIKKCLSQNKATLKVLETNTHDEKLNELKVTSLKNTLRELTIAKKRYEEQKQILQEEIDQYQFYIEKNLLDIEKLDKLKTAKYFLSALPITACPHCSNDYYVDEKYELETSNCSLCGNKLKEVKKSESSDLLGYLKDERKDFEKLLSCKITSKKNIENKIYLINCDLNETKKYLFELEKDLKPTHFQEYYMYSREIGKFENEITTLEKQKLIISKYEDLKKDIKRHEDDIRELKKEIKDSGSKKDDRKKINYFNKEFKLILKKLEFMKNGFSGSFEEEIEKHFKAISIDENDFNPKINGRNFITSASGLVRIIIAYYIALLKTSLHFKDTNHLNFILFDEPRQQNLDLDTFNKFTEILLELKNEYPNNFQVIFTSGNKGFLSDEDTSLDLGKTEYLMQEES